MKKVACVALIIGIIILGSMSWMAAQAELKLRGTGWEYKKGNYIVLESESGEQAKVYVTEEEMEDYILQDFKACEKESLSQTWWGRIMLALGIYH